jgi:two-component system, response regulator YesN
MHLLPDDLERVSKVKAYVEQHYRDRITYATLTSKFPISERKLSADFKKQYKQTIYDFLTSVRVARAKELLETTSYTVDAIAHMVGYHKTNLDIQFKKLTGMAPQDWRKTHLNLHLKE